MGRIEGFKNDLHRLNSELSDSPLWLPGRRLEKQCSQAIDMIEGIAERFDRYGPITACGFNMVPVTEPYDLVINATSAGLGGENPPYPAAAISESTFCYDLSYGLNPTPFSTWARDQGAAKSVMGWGMLVEQAAESFEIWRGIRPDTAPVLKQMHINA